jgi:hypothetical protein
VPEELDDRARRLANDLSRVQQPSAASVRRTALKRRRTRVIVAAAVVIAGGVTVAATTLGSGRHPSIQVVTSTPTTTAPATRPATTVITTPPTTATALTSPPNTASSTSAAPTTTLVGKQLPISVESDSQMKADGNNGPSSSILLPTSCELAGTAVRADGEYANGEFVPNVYNRYGDIIVLYVFAAPSPGYPQGIQLGVSGVSDSPAVGVAAPWQVTVSVDLSVGKPARCVVAAQPTHDVQLAP